GQDAAGKRAFQAGRHGGEGQSAEDRGTLDGQFLVTDYQHTVPVKYSGILPDLFREGQGVVAHGRMKAGTFVADEILAKHDEKYMPPEVARSLKSRHGESRANATAAPSVPSAPSAPAEAGAPPPHSTPSSAGT